MIDSNPNPQIERKISLIECQGYDIQARIDKYYELQKLYHQAAREVHEIYKYLHLEKRYVNNKFTGNYMLSDRVSESEWGAIKQFTVKSSDNPQVRVIIRSKENEVEQILGIPVSRWVLTQLNLAIIKKQYNKDMYDLSFKFYKHISEYFEINCRRENNLMIKEKQYPIYTRPNSRSIYYTLKTTLNDLKESRGQWWVIDKQYKRISFVINSVGNSKVSRVGKHRFVPDVVYYIPYNETIEALIKIAGKRNIQSVLRNRNKYQTIRKRWS